MFKLTPDTGLNSWLNTQPLEGSHTCSYVCSPAFSSHLFEMSHPFLLLSVPFCIYTSTVGPYEPPVWAPSPLSFTQLGLAASFHSHCWCAEQWICVVPYAGSSLKLSYLQEHPGTFLSLLTIRKSGRKSGFTTSSWMKCLSTACLRTSPPCKSHVYLQLALSLLCVKGISGVIDDHSSEELN